MKRIETIEDAYEAMQMNSYLCDYVMNAYEDDKNCFQEENDQFTEHVLKECRTILADALDESQTLQRLHLYIKGINEKITDALDSLWIPSLDECIDHWLINAEESEPLWNLIIDDGKVYRLYECYAEHEDKTFIMREEFYPSIDDWNDSWGEWQMPNQELMGWYCGCPTKESTNKFYGKC